MKKEMNTYTYTARNAYQPEKVLTFTLEGDYLKVSLTGLEDNLSEIVSNAEDLKGLKVQLAAQSGPAALRVLEGVSGPVHIKDVKVDLSGEDQDHFRITLWKRLAGLRAAPVILDMGEIDNPPAAKRFLEELRSRQESASKIRKFIGILDYWLGWIGVALLAVILIRRPSEE
jgi:hypothetical protein